MMNLPLNVDFTGKVVVVTGAGGVLCGDMARAFAQAGARTKVYVGYLDFEALVNYMKTELGGTIPEEYKEPQGRITIIRK